MRSHPFNGAADLRTQKRFNAPIQYSGTLKDILLFKKKKKQQNYHFHCSIISFIWFCALSVFKPSYWTHKHGLIQTFISYMPSTQKCTKLFVAEIYCLINIQDFINTSLSNSFLFGSVLVHGDFQTGKMDIWHFEHLFFFSIARNLWQFEVFPAFSRHADIQCFHVFLISCQNVWYCPRMVPLVPFTP